MSAGGSSGNFEDGSDSVGEWFSNSQGGGERVANGVTFEYRCIFIYQPYRHVGWR